MILTLESNPESSWRYPPPPLWDTQVHWTVTCVRSGVHITPYTTIPNDDWLMLGVEINHVVILTIGSMMSSCTKNSILQNV